MPLHGQKHSTVRSMDQIVCIAASQVLSSPTESAQRPALVSKSALPLAYGAGRWASLAMVVLPKNPLSPCGGVHVGGAQGGGVPGSKQGGSKPSEAALELHCSTLNPLRSTPSPASSQAEDDRIEAAEGSGGKGPQEWRQDEDGHVLHLDVAVPIATQAQP